MKKRIIIISSVIVLIVITLFIIITFNKSPLNYPYHGILNENIISVSDGKKYGYIKSNGKVIFRIKNSIKNVDNLSNLYFNDGIGTYFDNNLYGLINERGKIIVEAKYSKIKIFNKNLILVQKNSKEYFINYKGKKISKKEYFEIQYDEKEETTSFITLNKKRQYGVADNKGNVILENIYSRINKFYDKEDKTKYIYVAYSDNKIEVFNNKGEKIKIDNASIISYYKDDFIYYKDNKSNIYVYDIKNDKLINYKNEYKELFPFYNGIARVLTKDNKIGYINIDNEYVIKPIYEMENFSSDLQNGIAIASKKTDLGLKAGIINENGNVVIDFVYDEITLTKSLDRYILTKDNKYFITDKEGRIISDKYDVIYETNYKGYFIVMLKEKNKELYGILDENLNLIEEIKYKDIEFNENGIILQIDKNKIKII